MNINIYYALYISKYYVIYIMLVIIINIIHYELILTLSRMESGSET